MEPFSFITGVAASIPLANINTDIIAPKVLMRAVSREGLGWGLFGPYRYADDGAEKPDFVLNREPFRSAKIVLALENFGCGSSREHAAWAMLDFGIRVVIATSFAEIFFNNCSKNGILLVTLPESDVRRIMEVADTGEPITVDLQGQTICTSRSTLASFNIAEPLKRALLEGRDEIDTTLTFDGAINDYENRMFDQTPWLRSGVLEPLNPDRNNVGASRGYRQGSAV